MTRILDNSLKCDIVCTRRRMWKGCKQTQKSLRYEFRRNPISTDTVTKVRQVGTCNFTIETPSWKGQTALIQERTYRRGTGVRRTGKWVLRYSTSRRERMQLSAYAYLPVKASQANEDAKRCAHPSEINTSFTPMRTRSFNRQHCGSSRCKCSRCSISNWFWIRSSHDKSIVYSNGSLSKFLNWRAFQQIHEFQRVKTEKKESNGGKKEAGGSRFCFQVK